MNIATFWSISFSLSLFLSPFLSNASPRGAFAPKKAIFNHHYNDMMKIVKTKTKLENIQDEDFSDVQEYFGEKSVENTRLAFKIRTQMVAEISGNYKNKYRVKGTEKEGLVCMECQDDEIMTQSHCLTCTAWAELREGIDLTNIKDLVIFFRKLLVARSKVMGTASHDSSSGGILEQD